MAQIIELQAKQTKVEVEGAVISVSNVYEFNKMGRVGRVANAVLQDETGEMKLTLWNEEIDKVRQGNIVKIKNGYVNEWNGEKQLMVGRFGHLEIVK